MIVLKKQANHLCQVGQRERDGRKGPCAHLRFPSIQAAALKVRSTPALFVRWHLQCSSLGLWHPTDVGSASLQSLDFTLSVIPNGIEYLRRLEQRGEGICLAVPAGSIPGILCDS